MRRPTNESPLNSAPFAALNRRERARLANIGTIVQRPSGSVLATRGTVARQVVMILGGVATAFRLHAPERLGAGEQFGALEVMTRSAHSDTILAESAVSVWVLTIAEFRTMLRQIPSLAEWYAASLRSASDVRATEPTASAASVRPPAEEEASLRHFADAR
jgi:CRP-like cAMP-binding protein